MTDTDTTPMESTTLAVALPDPIESAGQQMDYFVRRLTATREKLEDLRSEFDAGFESSLLETSGSSIEYVLRWKLHETINLNRRLHWYRMLDRAERSWLQKREVFIERPDDEQVPERWDLTDGDEAWADATATLAIATTISKILQALDHARYGDGSTSLATNTVDRYKAEADEEALDELLSTGPWAIYPHVKFGPSQVTIVRYEK